MRHSTIFVPTQSPKSAMYFRCVAHLSQTSHMSSAHWHHFWLPPILPVSSYATFLVPPNPPVPQAHQNFAILWTCHALCLCASAPVLPVVWNALLYLNFSSFKPSHFPSSIFSPPCSLFSLPLLLRVYLKYVNPQSGKRDVLIKDMSHSVW